MINRAIYYVRNNRDRIHRLSGEGSWILVGQVASVLGSLVLVRVLTEYLDPAEYGELALGLTIAALVHQVVMGGIIAGIGRFYSIAADKGDLGGYLQASKRLLTYATLVVILMSVVLIGELVIADQGRWIGLVVAVLIFSIISAYNSALNGVQNAARQRAVVALHSGMDAWLKIGLAVGMMLLLGAAGTTVVLGYAMSALLVTGSQLLFLKRLMRRQSVTHNHEGNENWQWQIWLFSWPMMAGGLFNWGYYASQRWALELFMSTDDVGKFYALTQIAYTPVVLAFTLLMSFLTPILYARVGDPSNLDRVAQTHTLIYRLAAIGIGATFVLAAVAYLGHEVIFRLFVAEHYRDISFYMPIIAFAAGILQSSLMLGTIFTSSNRTLKILPLATLGQSIIIMLNFLLAWKWGVSGLVWSVVLGAIIHLAWMYRLVLNEAASDER